MRYILNEPYCLRGWYKKPTGLMNADSREVVFPEKENYLLLLQCDGRHEIESKTLGSEQQAFLAKLEEKGIVRPAMFWDILKPEQVYRTYPARFLQSIQWSVTGACNMKCRHCFMSAPHARHGSPSREELIRIIDQMEECGVLQVDLTGGEPLIRDDFMTIIDTLLERKIRIRTVFTNGWLVNEELLDKLDGRKTRPVFQLSYDGVGCHDFLRGVPGAEERTLNAIRLLRERDYTVSAAMCLHKKNRHVVRETVNLMASMGVSSMKLGAMVQEGEWARPEVRELQLTPAEEQSIFEEYIPQYFEDNAPMRIMLGGSFMYIPGAPEWKIYNEKACPAEEEDITLACGTLGTGLYIGAEGMVAPCMAMCDCDFAANFPNLKETPLREILRESELMKLCHASVADVRNGNDQCRNCEYTDLCTGGCRNAALASSGNYYGVDPDVCAFFRNGWHKRIREIAQPAFEAYIKRCPPKVKAGEPILSECP